MYKYDRISSLIWVGIAVVICMESIRLDPGSLSQPGPGLVPLGCGLIIGIFGFIIFVGTLNVVAEDRNVILKERTHWGKLVSVPIAIIGYAFLIDILGFRLVTFLWMSVI